VLRDLDHDGHFDQVVRDAHEDGHWSASPYVSN
jgi:hypothetical protein